MEWSLKVINFHLKIHNSFMKALLNIGVLGFLFISNLQAQDSTLVYTLKDNERIIYLSEHRLLASHTGVGHLLFLERPTGYFILFNGKEFGPYQDVEFSESKASLFDWAVSRNGKWYQLILDQGLLAGPYDNVVDVYRPEADLQSYLGNTIANNHFGFRAQKGKLWYINVNNKEYGPYKEDDWGTPYFYIRNGYIMASTEREYQMNVDDLPRGDSIRVGPASSKPSTMSLDKRELMQAGKSVMTDILEFKEDKTRQHYLAINSSGDVFLDGQPTNTVKADLSWYAGVPYRANGPFNVFPTGEYFYTYKNEDKYFYFVSRNKQSIEIPEESLESITFSKDGSHLAYVKKYEIVIDDKKVHDYGFSLVYNSAIDGFSWLSVKGRNIYVHSYKP